MNEHTEKYRAADLEGLAREILVAAGLEREKAVVVASGLLEGDLMGATTHGLALLAGYVDELENGEMTATGNPEVLSDFGATTLWDGRYLPGVWLTREAGDADDHGSGAGGTGGDRFCLGGSFRRRDAVAGARWTCRNQQRGWRDQHPREIGALPHRARRAPAAMARATGSETAPWALEAVSVTVYVPGAA